MKRINEQRPKAFIGAAISVGTSIVSGIIGNRKKKKAEQAERLRQERLQNLQNHQALASAQNESMMSEEDRTQFLSQYLSKGGRVKTSPRKEVKARIVEGGTAIPIKKDSFLLKGRKHNAGGIVIDAGKTGVEAEGGEVVQITPKQLKVFSAQPILNGNSPAELVQKGVEPSKVFNAQESFKDKNGLNDDGTKKKKVMGGKDKFGNKLAESSKSQIMQRIPKYNKLNINRGTFNGGKGSGGGAGTKFNYSDDIIEINKKDTIYVPIERNRKLRTTNKNTKMKNGGIRKIYPSLSGRYDGINAGKAIRSLREARTNSNYQYNNGNNVPSMPSLNSELRPIKREDVKKEISKPKKQSFSSAFAEARKQGLKIFEWNGKKYGTQLANEVTKKPTSNNIKPKTTKVEPKVKTIEKELPEVVITAPRKKQPVSNNSSSNKIESKAKTNNIPEVNVVGSRISKMINDNTFVPGRYPNSSNNVTTPRESTSTSLYKGIKSMLGYPNRKKSALGSKTKLLKDNYNNFGLEKDYSKSFAPNALTKANMNSVKTNSIVPTKPVGASISSSTSPLSKSGGFKNFMSGIGGEAISAGIGALGNIISGVTNKNSINNIQAPTRPRTVVPARMRTTYNINPQLAESRDSERNMARLIDSNTSSSSGKIARIQSLANRGVLERNKLRGMKENVETDLLNRSTLNRQGVEAANNQILNAYDNAVTQTENEKIQARANNRTNIIEGLTSAVRDYQLGVDKRRSEENATAAMMSANPEQMELFLKLMNKNKGRLSNIRSTLFKCGGKKKIA
ncbi:hypothetical protein KNV28_gp38 [uncultured phage cr107_1]|uniref:Uncharacterized protein n=1 Tax=uncultured phage cr107_1 TaxID=2772061 RepID=A0A7M1RUY2_9CAUD|nr:hypothetical protein KNV28_gp38 [uncultured phage cr107_1]QOR58213.1 hypothetical protein [uncultured phage cr107_1]